MPWKCPACAIEVHHTEAEPIPRVGAIYRCPACRIELVVDTRTNKMKIAPIAAASDGKGARRRPRKRQN